MSARIDSSGEIETLFHDSILQRNAEVGDRLAIVFRTQSDVDGSFSVNIFSPSGAKILERVLRDLPTGMPQSAPPVEFVPSSKGDYTVEVRVVRGTQRGHATIKVG
ncbi:MAG: hypothetical protein U0414_44105 [Polyangiaceae bacterium]